MNHYGNSGNRTDALKSSHKEESYMIKAEHGVNPVSQSINPYKQMNPMTQADQGEAEVRIELYPTLQNIVSTVNLSCVLDLKKINANARNAEYNPKRFAAVIMRLRDPKTTALVFKSGKMVCTGAKSEEASLKAARRFARIIEKIGFNVKFKDFKIQNIVGSADVKFPIKLDELTRGSHSKFCQYEPELFPGLIYKMINPKVVLLIFVSGKLVLTGAKTKDEINLAFKQIYHVLKEHRKAP